jgi:hypothetical protein
MGKESRTMLRQVWTRMCAVRKTCRARNGKMKTTHKLGWIATELMKTLSVVPCTVLDKIP